MELSPHARKQEEMAIDSGGRKQQSNVESGPSSHSSNIHGPQYISVVFSAMEAAG